MKGMRLFVSSYVLRRLNLWCFFRCCFFVGFFAYRYCPSDSFQWWQTWTAKSTAATSHLNRRTTEERENVKIESFFFTPLFCLSYSELHCPAWLGLAFSIFFFFVSFSFFFRFFSLCFFIIFFFVLEMAGMTRNIVSMNMRRRLIKCANRSSWRKEKKTKSKKKKKDGISSICFSNIFFSRIFALQIYYQFFF